jgi:hypothetical protein
MKTMVGRMQFEQEEMGVRGAERSNGGVRKKRGGRNHPEPPELSGPSAGQSSLIHSLDIFLVLVILVVLFTGELVGGED